MHLSEWADPSCLGSDLLLLKEAGPGGWPATAELLKVTGLPWGAASLVVYSDRDCFALETAQLQGRGKWPPLVSSCLRCRQLILSAPGLGENDSGRRLSWPGSCYPEESGHHSTVLTWHPEREWGGHHDEMPATYGGWRFVHVLSQLSVTVRAASLQVAPRPITCPRLLSWSAVELPHLSNNQALLSSLNPSAPCEIPARCFPSSLHTFNRCVIIFSTYLVSL